MADIEFAARSALHETGSMIHGLGRTGPRPLRGHGGAPRTTARRAAGFDLDIDASDHIGVRAEVEHGLLAILNEAISKATRHAHSSRLMVGLSTHQDSIRLRISDAGRGVDPDSAEPAQAGGSGLLGMLGRAKEFGGHLSITSTPGRGTTIQVALPKADGHPSNGVTHSPKAEAHPSIGEPHPGPRPRFAARESQRA